MKQFALSALGAGVLLGFGPQAYAHVEYFDLNQGYQIADLTATGKANSTTQYGQTAASVVALGNVAANGLAPISVQSDRPLNDTTQWNGTNQSYTGVGTFANVAYTKDPAGNQTSPVTFQNANTVDINSVTDFGWGAGTKPTLGDSHKVDWFNFRLAEESTVTITWNVDDGAFFYDGAFSLYQGVLNFQGHDDGNEKLNPKGATPPFPRVQDALDGATAANGNAIPLDAQGIASAFRNTTATGPGDYVGQFNALANWGQSNNSGNWGNVAFIKAVNANTGSVDGFSASASDTIETLTMTLGPGNYSIAASGALGAIANAAAGTLGSVPSFGLTGLHGKLTFAATPTAVPVPAAVWLLGSALVGMGVIGRRKDTVTA